MIIVAPLILVFIGGAYSRKTEFVGWVLLLIVTRNGTLQTWMFPAVPVGGLLPIALPLALLCGGRWGAKTAVRSHQAIQIFELMLAASQKYKWTVTAFPCYTSWKFDEKLHQHISRELADNASRKSDTS